LCIIYQKKKFNHHKQDILVRLGWHRRIVPKHWGHVYHLDDDPYTLRVLLALQLNV